MRISDGSSDVVLFRSCGSETMTLEYKGYTAGPVEFDDDQGLFHGTVAGLRDVVTFAGRSAVELKTAFRESIDDYLDFCAQEGRDPDRPFSGKDRKSVVQGKSVSVRVDLGGRGSIKK